MGTLLTAGSSLACPHGGTVTAIPSQTAASAGGTPIVTAADTFMVAGCAFVIGVVPSPCVLVNWIVPNVQCSAAPGPTLSLDSVGLCVAATGAVQGPVMITATQAKVAGT
jgi:hypothetical protein